MMLAISPLSPAESRLIHVFRLRALGWWTVLVIAAAALEYWVADVIVPRGIVAGPVLLIALWRVARTPYRRWRKLGYAYTGTELHVAEGLMIERYTIVPVSRVQHLDIAQGPLERLFRIYTLILHTAGSEANIVAVPGLARANAEAIRDSIREKIGSLAE